jgi:hypothetical protein
VNNKKVAMRTIGASKFKIVGSWTLEPTGFVIDFLCLFLNFIPSIFYLLGAIMPRWVYGTFLSFSFNGAEFLQVASVPIVLFGAVLAAWTSKALGQQASNKVEGKGET